MAELKGQRFGWWWYMLALPTIHPLFARHQVFRKYNTRYSIAVPCIGKLNLFIHVRGISQTRFNPNLVLYVFVQRANRASYVHVHTVFKSKLTSRKHHVFGCVIMLQSCLFVRWRSCWMAWPGLPNSVGQINHPWNFPLKNGTTRVVPAQKHVFLAEAGGFPHG